MRIDLIFTVSDIYINSNLKSLAKLSSCSRSTEFKYNLPLNITQMITKTARINSRIVISYVRKQGIPFLV